MQRSTHSRTSGCCSPPTPRAKGSTSSIAAAASSTSSCRGIRCGSNSASAASTRIGQTRRVHAFHLVADRHRRTRAARSPVVARQARAGAGSVRPIRCVADPNGPTRRRRGSIVLGADTRSCGRPRAGRPTSASRSRAWSREAACGSARGCCWLAGSLPPIVGAVLQVPRTCASRPLVCWSRGARYERPSGGGPIGVFRTSVTDADGRTVASRVDSVLCDRIPAARTAALALDGSAFESHLSGRAQWIDDAVRAHGEFARARLARADRLVGLAEASWSPMQPGLFDRRVEQQHDVASAVQQELVAAARERLDRAGGRVAHDRFRTGAVARALRDTGPPRTL